MIEIKGLQKTYSGGVQAVRGVDLSLERGKTLALVGESGCGKSTLAKHLLQIEKIQEGIISIDGKPLSSLAPIELARRVQMVFQDPSSSLNPRKRISSLLEEPLIVQGKMSTQERQIRVVEMLQAVGLDPQMGDRFPHMLSGGQKQRVAIARALMTGADYLICDEPVSALDVSVQAQIINLLRHLQKKMNLGLLFISHDLSVVRLVAHDVAIMYLGKIVELGSVKDIFDHSAHPYTKLLISSTPRFDQDAFDLSLRADELPSPKNPPPGCSFYSRCSWAQDSCRVEIPRLEQWRSQQVACWQIREILK